MSKFDCILNSEFTLGVLRSSCYPIFSLYVCFVDRCLSFCTCSFGLCVVCSSLIYGFWLHNWHHQTLLTLYQLHMHAIILIYVHKKFNQIFTEIALFCHDHIVTYRKSDNGLRNLFYEHYIPHLFGSYQTSWESKTWKVIYNWHVKPSVMGRLTDMWDPLIWEGKLTYETLCRGKRYLDNIKLEMGIRSGIHISVVILCLWSVVNDHKHLTTHGPSDNGNKRVWKPIR